MPAYQFDVTEKCINFIKESIKDMPGNNGQRKLLEDLVYDCKFIVDVNQEEGDGDTEISPNKDINFTSNHPEAIEIILEMAGQHGELISEQSAIPGPWRLSDAVRTGNWKIVGLDSEWNS